MAGVQVNLEGDTPVSMRDLFEAELQPVKPSLDVWVDSLSEADRAEVLVYASNGDLSHQGFLRVLKAQGVRSSKDTVSSWRRAHGFPRG